MSQQAGWYDDPQDPNSLRYWDGVQWTNHTSPRQKPDLEQSGQAAAGGDWGQGGTSAPGQPQQDAGQGQWGGQQQGQWGGQQGGADQAQQNPYAPQQQNPYAGQTGQQPYPGGQQGWGAAPMPGGAYAGTYGGPTTPDGQPLAGWGMRFLARIIDGILTTIVLATIGLTVVTPDLIDQYLDWFDELATMDPNAQASFTLPDELQRSTTTFTLFFAAGLLVYEVVLVRLFGGTLGKLMTGLRVRLRDQPGSVPWGSALIRGAVWTGPSFLGWVPVLGNVIGLFTIVNGLWPLWDSKKQSLNDKVAKTNVVKRRA